MSEGFSEFLFFCISKVRIGGAITFPTILLSYLVTQQTYESRITSLVSVATMPHSLPFHDLIMNAEVT